MSTELTTTESQTLSDCERIINRGLIGFAELGRALIKVRDGKLFRATHETFLDYCSDRWGIGKSRAYQLIEASGVVDSMPPERSTIVDSESKARELAKVPAEKRSQVVEVAAAAGPVTAKSIREAAAQVVEPPPAPKLEPEPQPEQEPQDDPEPESEVTGPEPSAPVRQAPDALYQGEKAIAFLEQIDADDPNRDMAFDNVVAWIGRARN
jgi:hypothetical protein